ncbi:MAG TPA: hypothetical protein VH062_20270 [Polyangiaceae bacterium]|jgi:hypothetical protein|nr:hypothetical protein [Polyangiaceae bacterium]
MAIRAAAAGSEPEEILFENAKVSLCLLLNRHSHTVRIFDFRAGADPTKRGYVLSIAQREGVERVFTVVERDEVSVWSRLGFDKEGTIPGFFKRSDAYVLGTTVPNVLAGDTAPPPSHEALNPEAFEAAAEKVYQEAKRIAKDLPAPSPRAVRLQPSAQAITKKAVAAATRAGRALTRFDPFGRRDVERAEYHITARGGWSLIASVERQPCFDNAFIEVLTAPRNERDVGLTNAALHQLTDRLGKEGTVACFAFSPTIDAGFAATFVANGFRRTGTLPGHLLIGGKRQGAFLWTRKLATPTDDE